DKNTTLSANIVTTVKNAVNSITVGLTFENEFGYMYDLVNGADFDSISNFKTYLSDNLMNTDGSSKSGIITREVLYDLIIEMVDGFEIDGLDISTEVVSCLTADKADPTVSIIDVLDEIDDLKAEVEGIANNIPAEADINRTYLANLGAQIDGLADYSLILNANAVKSIGDHITDKLYNSLSAEAKSAIQTTYNNKNNYATFAALYAAFADDLGL
ncbi:MAG: hypothetical protein J6T39_01365, partial [Clostridia bacterium]|nr:hypothetical protein [Clostridia bacterium]